jgi:hypothetical protein
MEQPSTVVVASENAAKDPPAIQMALVGGGGWQWLIENSRSRRSRCRTNPHCNKYHNNNKNHVKLHFC